MHDPNDIMIPTGKNDKVILTNDGLFLNSKAIIIEYDDIIKSPYFVLLLAIKDNEEINKIFDLSEIRNMSFEELYEWYIFRKKKNVFLNFNVKKEFFENVFHNNPNDLLGWIEKFTFDELDEIPDIVNYDSALNFVESLKALKTLKMIEKIIIFSPQYSDTIYHDIGNLFGRGIMYCYGDLKAIIQKEKITYDSTFVFSDIRHIADLHQTDTLNYSSILVADFYGYNTDKDGNYVIDLKKYQENNQFKLDFFNNIGKQQ